MRWFIWFALGSCLAHGADLTERIASLAGSSVVAQRAFWGMQATDLETGKAVFAHNAGKLFIPASNAKLFSTALALSRLGPNHRFRTIITASKPLAQDGVLSGDLVLLGGGDPTLSAREFPYRKGPIRGDPLAPLAALADQLVEKGLRRVEGDIIGDDTAFVREPYPAGWDQDDVTWEYGAPVSALTLHDNTFRLTVRAAREAGQPALLYLNPPVEYYVINNLVRTVDGQESGVTVQWPPGSREINLSGTLRRGRGARTLLLALRDPARYAAWALARVLELRGISVRGDVRVRHRWIYDVEDLKRGPEPLPVEGVVLAERLSPPLFEILQIVNKVSQNLHAELVLREVGRVRRKIGSLEAGLDELKEFLGEAGIAEEEFHFEDASGLSRLDLVTPAAVTRLLVYMWQSPERDRWRDLLAVGGQDGTLDDRFRDESVNGRIQAKTGTMSHVSALAGYAQRRSGGQVAFSILVNNYDLPSDAARAFIDRIVEALIE